MTAARLEEIEQDPGGLGTINPKSNSLTTQEWALVQAHRYQNGHKTSALTPWNINNRLCAI